MYTWKSKMKTIRINNLSKNIKNKVILKNINLTLKESKVYGLLGNNGVGKTTLIKCIFNEFKINEGKILVNDHQISFDDLKDMHYFPENVDLPKEMTVFDYLQIQYLLHKNNLDQFKEKINRESYLLKDINFKKTKINSLSSGQQKIVSIILCKILDPNIIFFDEPTANLDISNKNIVLNEIKNMKNQNKIIVIVTHLIKEVEHLLDEIIILNNQTIVLNKPVKDENLEQLFLKTINQELGTNKC